MEIMEILCVILISILISTFLIFDFFRRKKIYESGSYYKITNIPFISIGRDIGSYGEYLIYEILQHLELEKARFLFNLYIPTYNGKTTEIDVVMISQCGIFVFESKNYSGWIFGDEVQKKWTQSLHIGYGETQKEYFFNPIMQNQYHIDYLQKLINKDMKIHSIVVFSDRCELKNIRRKSDSKTYLIYRSELIKTVNDIQNAMVDSFLTYNQIDEIYNMLYKYSQASELVKQKHISDINSQFF